MINHLNRDLLLELTVSRFTIGWFESNTTRLTLCVYFELSNGNNCNTIIASCPCLALDYQCSWKSRCQTRCQLMECSPRLMDLQTQWKDLIKAEIATYDFQRFVSLASGVNKEWHKGRSTTQRMIIFKDNINWFITKIAN